MELSELVRFNRNFFAMCDMTGIIWKALPALPPLRTPRHLHQHAMHRCLPLPYLVGCPLEVVPEDGRVYQRYAIADGNGDETKPFKIEWATVKDHVLWVGSVGKEIKGSLR